MDESYSFREFYIPARMMPSILEYVDHRVPPGDFLRAVISNDLRGACVRGENENLRNLPAYVPYFYNEVPSECLGIAGENGRVAQRSVNPRKRSALAANPGGRVAVVCHGDVINAWAGHVLGISDPFFSRRRLHWREPLSRRIDGRAQRR